MASLPPMRLFRIAWRNLWRNPRRSAIALAAMSVSTAALIATDALIFGLADRIVSNVTELGVGEAQVHAPKFLSERSLYQSIDAPLPILALARERGLAAAPRASGVGLLALGNRSAGVQLWGVDAPAERAVGQLPIHLASGAYLPDAPAQKIVLGRKLARTLGATLGAELVAVVRDAQGSTGSGLFVVAGVLGPVSEALDRGGAFIARPEFEELFLSPGRVHEIALSSAGRLSPAEVARAVTPAAGSAEVRDWPTLMPAVAEFAGLWDGFSLVIGGLFFLAAGLGVLNSNLMASYERVPEFGLAKALGATPFDILREVAAEATLLASLSTLLGAGVGVALAHLLSVYGLDLSSMSGTMSFSGMSMEPVWRAKLTPAGVWQPIAMMWAVSFAAALYPAAKASRLDPVIAMNRV
ncbi:MAG: ABC transporter permease [Myxococcaceae bacterium]